MLRKINLAATILAALSGSVALLYLDASPSLAQTNTQLNSLIPESSACNQPLPQVVTEEKIPDANSFYGAVSADGCWIFVSVQGGPKGNRLLLYSKTGGAVKLQREIPSAEPFGWFRITRDQKTLIAAGTNKLWFLDVEKIISGQKDPVIGSLNDRHFGRMAGSAFSADEKFLFVNQNNTSWTSVIDIENARANGFSPSAVVAGAPTGVGPIGLELSPGDKYLYVGTAPAEGKGPTDFSCRNPQEPAGPPDRPMGALTVMNVKLDGERKLSEVATVPTGCGTVWMSLSKNGNFLFVALREEDVELVFDTRPVKEGKPPVLVDKIPVGKIPTHSEFIGDGSLLVVSNSNQFATTPSTTDTLTIIDTNKIGSGSKAVLGTVSVGADPRRMFVSNDGGTLLVDSFKSGMLQIIDTKRLDSKIIRK